ncbi:hypothetical protein BE17_50875 [Sorangium cellulosum]|uniref:Uncharacterized protein n=1 Tax=Sorangium cellulosum TaxID=56 RepID=A0A150SH71_SORCE|nr:hypothetical protein BE17_50875 [Sorangium cellulosum]
MNGSLHAASKEIALTSTSCVFGLTSPARSFGILPSVSWFTHASMTPSVSAGSLKSARCTGAP